MGLLDWVKNREASTTNARNRKERASRAAQSMSERRGNENAREFLDLENNAIREPERKDAKQPQVKRQEPGGEESQKPSRTQSKYAGLFDRVPETESEVKRDAFSTMGSVIRNIANDHDSDWSKHWVPFEEAVLGIRKAFASRIDMLDPRPEKGESKAEPRDTKMSRERASPQRNRKGRSWER